MVTYKDIADFPGYRVGSDGSVWTKRGRWGFTETWRQMAPSRQRSGPHRGRLSVNLHCGHYVTRRVHRLVLEAFVGPCPPHCECCHADGNPSNNNMDNLRWDTRASNMLDKVRHGRQRGTKHPHAILTDDLVRTIRARATAGETRTAIAASLGLKKRLVNKIATFDHWTHI